MKKIVISWVLCVLALVGLFAWLGSGVFMGNVGNPEQGEPLVKADFTLEGPSGTVVTAKSLKGKFMLVYFGFTHCPDICPTTLLLMNNALTQLGEKAAQVQPIFISVDPERDTPDLAAEYARNFNPRFMGLSGTPAQVKHAADSFKVYYSKVEDAGSALGYVVDHSGFIYLMGPDGNYVTHFASTVTEAELKKELARYVP